MPLASSISSVLPVKKGTVIGTKPDPSTSTLKVCPTASGAWNIRLASLVSVKNGRSPVVNPNAGAPNELAASGLESINCGGRNGPVVSPLYINLNGPNPVPPLSSVCQPSAYTASDALSAPIIVA